MRQYSYNNIIIIVTFLFDYNDVRALEVFKWTATYIFKSKATKIKLAKKDS